MVEAYSETGNDARPLNAAIVGGGKGCVSIMRMVEEGTLQDFPMRILGVADVKPDAPGILHAREVGVPVVTLRYRDLYEIPGLDLIIELTGIRSLTDEIERTRPSHVHIIDHVVAGLLWKLHQAQQSVIVHRTEMEKRVEAERERVTQILNSIPDEILVLDREMIVQDTNSSFLKNNNMTLEQARGQHCYDIPQLVRGECQIAVGDCRFRNVTETGRSESFVRKHYDEKGQVRYTSIVGAPWRDRDGRVVGMIEITRDITQRIRLEEDLQVMEVQLQKLMEMAPQATWVKDRNGRYNDVNPAACKLFGKSAGEIMGRTDLELFPRDAAEKLKHGDQEALKKGDSVSYQIDLELENRKVFLSIVKFPMTDKDGKRSAVCGIAEDVTAQKEAEIQLKSTQEYLQNIIDNSPVLIITSNMEGNIVSFNRGAEESLGYRAEEVIGGSGAVLFIDPSLREDLLSQVHKTGKPVRDYSLELKRKDGSPVPVSMTLSQLHDSSGRTIGIVGISKDISQRKALMGQIIQSERQAAVGRLASGVAHEINNPLAIIAEIAGFLNELMEAESGKVSREFMEELRDGLPKILKHVNRGKDITRRLLTFARKTEDRVQLADVNASLEEILPFLEKQARLANVAIHRDYQDNISKVPIEELQLQEIFINLITNAIQALGDREQGNIWLTTREEDGKVTISVRDDGKGIDDSVRDRLFDPFTTTKPTGIGTGLGLSICYGIVKRHDGEIRVSSSPGQGAAFTVILPVVKVKTSQENANEQD
ncbi:MAG: PAS domain S-box protein [Acidobacteria bacterium]|nr:PAS domain S-box protein [Acidobacteriota bacterium]